jgi:hypothetical protein
MEVFSCCLEVNLSRVTVYKFPCVVNVFVRAVHLLLLKTCIERRARSSARFKALKERSDKLPVDLVVLAAFERRVCGSIDLLQCDVSSRC